MTILERCNHRTIMKKKLLGLGIVLLGLATAQSAAVLLIEGKKAALPWITVKDKVYIPLESLQKAGMVIKKSGNTYELTFPKPKPAVGSSTTPVTPVPVGTVTTTTVASPVTQPVPTTPVTQPVPTTPVAQTPTPPADPSNPEPQRRNSSLNPVVDPQLLSRLLGINTGSSATTASSTQTPALKPSSLANVLAPPVSTPPTPTPTPPTMTEPSPSTPPTPTPPTPTAAPPTIATGATITISAVNSTNTKPQLEGCATQVLNNGVWSAKLVAVTQISLRERPGYAFVLELANLSKDAISLFDAGFSDGEGGLGNFILMTSDQRTFVSQDTNPSFIYQTVPSGQKLIFTLRFTFDSTPAAPSRLLITQERRIPGFVVPDPSLRFQLDCK
jgi:hypothetical protein